MWCSGELEAPRLSGLALVDTCAISQTDLHGQSHSLSKPLLYQLLILQVQGIHQGYDGVTETPDVEKATNP